MTEVHESRKEQKLLWEGSKRYWRYPEQKQSKSLEAIEGVVSNDMM